MQVDVSTHEPWDRKTRSKVVWRGTITGIFHRSRWDWRSSHRDRISTLASNRTSTDQVEVLEEGIMKGLRARKWGLGRLVEKWLDVGVVQEVSLFYYDTSMEYADSLQDIHNMVCWRPRMSLKNSVVLVLLRKLVESMELNGVIVRRETQPVTKWSRRFAGWRG
jgi:hypothetical protein